VSPLLFLSAWDQAGVSYPQFGPGALLGTLDDPGLFAPQMAIYTVDSQPFHHIPDGMRTFERLPTRSAR